MSLSLSLGLYEGRPQEGVQPGESFPQIKEWHGSKCQHVDVVASKELSVEVSQLQSMK